jgi:hypothetical protein
MILQTDWWLRDSFRKFHFEAELAPRLARTMVELELS